MVRLPSFWTTTLCVLFISLISCKHRRSHPGTKIYPQVMKSGLTFYGSKIHTIDNERCAFADLWAMILPLATWSKAAGSCSTLFNLFGEEVTPKNIDPEDKAVKLGNQILHSSGLLSSMPLSQRWTSTYTTSAEPGTNPLIATAKVRALVMTSG